MKKGNRGFALLSSRAHRRGRLGGAMVLAAAGLALVAGMRMLKQRRPGAPAADEGQFAGSETDIDDRIAESFPASDPPWHP